MKRMPPRNLRRHLGDFSFKCKNGQTVRCAVFVDPEAIGAALVLKAHSAKVKRARRMGGAVLVEAL